MKKWNKAVRWMVAGILITGILISSLTVHASEEFTDTLQEDCVLAVRAEVFDGYGGTVEVVLRRNDGKETACTLDAGCSYARNLQVAEGSYTLVDVTAVEDGTVYEVKKMASGLLAAPGEIAVCRLVVTDYRIEQETEENSEVQKEDGMKEKEGNKVQVKKQRQDDRAFVADGGSLCRRLLVLELWQEEPAW